MIEVYSDGLDQDLNGSATFRPEFTTNGMFVINSGKININYRRGMNVLDYDPLTGNHNFEVFLVIFLSHEEIQNFPFVNHNIKSTLLFCLAGIKLIYMELRKSILVLAT